jgi:hypothetical protein
MAPMTELSRASREAVRLRFFREYRGDSGCTSVAVRNDKHTGEPFLSVGVSGDSSRLPSQFEGLPVVVYDAAPAVHAVQYTAA